MVELSHFIGIILAVGAAISNAVEYLLVRIGTEDGNPSDAVFIVILINTIILIPLVAVFYYPDYGLTRWSWISFIAAGILGTMLGRMFMFSSFKKIGASRTTPIVASWGLISTVLGVVILDESLSPVHGIGVVLTVGGIAAIAWETGQENPDNLSRRELLVGLLLPFGAALAFGWEPIFANFGFAEGTPAPVGLAVKTIAAAVGFTLYLRWHDALPQLTVSADIRWFILAGIASTAFLLGYYVALSIAPVSVVTPIIITNTLFVILLSILFMPSRLETVTWRLAAAATMVFGGVFLITFFG